MAKSEYERGEFIPEEGIKQVVVNENGVKKQRILIGKIERFGLPNYLHMYICLAGYYLSAAAIWKMLPSSARTVSGKTLSAWGLALGLSLLVIPALLITLALKMRRTMVVMTAVIAAVLQILFLMNSYMQNPESAAVYQIISTYPVHAFLAWVIPAGIMFFLEKNRKIKDIIHLEIPLYDE